MSATVEAQQLKDRSAGTVLHGLQASLAVDRHTSFWMVVKSGDDTYDVRIAKSSARDLIDNSFREWQLAEFSDYAVIEPFIAAPANEDES